MKLRLPLGGGKILILSLNHSFNWFVRTLIHSRTKKVPASQCVHYPPYLPQIVLKITNITFRMDSMHIETQAVTLWMNNWIDSLDSFKLRFIHKRNNAVWMEMCSGSVVSLFETILVDEIEQNHAILLYSDNVNHWILTFCLLKSLIVLICQQSPAVTVKLMLKADRRIVSAFWVIFCSFYNVNVPVICLQQQLQEQAYENTERV